MPHLTYAIDDSVATLVLNHPPQNRIDKQMSDELAAAVAAISRSDAAAALIRSDGPDFCCGGDIRTWPETDLNELRALFEYHLGVFNSVEQLPIPVIAAVHGICTGGGLELALRADVIFAGESARFGHSEATVGIVTLLGGVYRVAERHQLRVYVVANSPIQVPRDPLVAARQIGEQHRKGSVRLCSVIRCTHGTPGGGTVTRHAVTMCGLGQWGRVPGYLARWRTRHNVARRHAAALIGLERVNLLEYVAFGSARLLAGTVSASQCELVELDGTRRVRLLAAVALNLALPPMPHPGVTMSENAAGVIVIPRLGRPFGRRLEPGADFALRLLDRESVEFFLDEDPEVATGWLRLEMAGCIAFVPGSAE